jgi:hypothetical protein
MVTHFRIASKLGRSLFRSDSYYSGVLFFLVFIIACCVSCSKASEKEDPPPSVESCYPENESTGIAVNTNITLRFSESIKADSVKAGTVILEDGSIEVPGSISVNDRDIVFDPAVDLDNLKTYTLTVNNVIADNSGNTMRDIFTLTFTTVDLGTVPSPVPAPVGGTYPGARNVALSCADTEAVIVYTTDDSVPTRTNGDIYDTTPIPVASNTTIRAFAYREGYVDSQVSAIDYFIQTDQPQFSPSPSAYGADQTVTITATGANIYYTTNGDTPTILLTPEPDMVTIPVTGHLTIMTIKAFTTKSGNEPSDIVTAKYIICHSTIPALWGQSYFGVSKWNP